MSLRVTVLKEFLKAPSGLTASDVAELFEIEERTDFTQVYNCIQDAIRDGYLIRGEKLPEGVCYEITPQGMEYMKKSGKKEGRPMNKSPLAQKVKQPSKSAQTAPIEGKSALAQKVKSNTADKIDEVESKLYPFVTDAIIDGFEIRMPKYDINDDLIVMSDAPVTKPVVSEIPVIPINEKTVNEIKHHVNNSTPVHYQGKSIQVFDVLDEFMTPEAVAGFNAGNVIKYVLRFRGKDGKRDLLKARDYLNRMIESYA